MTEEMRHHLPVIIGTTLVGIVTVAVFINHLASIAGDLDIETFLRLGWIVPTVAMLVCTFIISATALEIGRKLFVVCLSICLATGVASLIAVSVLVKDPTISAQLIANTPGAEGIVAPMDSMFAVLRDIAAFVVAPTVGCVAGAWVGSRMHSVKVDKMR